MKFFKLLSNRFFGTNFILDNKKCIKNLYKSTYKDNAFTESEKYGVIDEDKDFFWLIDNMEQEFSMYKHYPSKGFYYFHKYFE